MKKVFADSMYWIALLNPHDEYHIKALKVAQEQTDIHVLTSDSVLSEVLNSFSSFNSFWRNTAANIIEKLFVQESITIIPWSRELFLEGFLLFKERSDKNYSHVDCTSMVIMKKENITEILSADHHFEQEGFALLLR